MNAILTLARDEKGKFSVLFVGQSGKDGELALGAAKDTALMKERGLQGFVEVQVVKGPFMGVFRKSSVDLDPERTKAKADEAKAKAQAAEEKAAGDAVAQAQAVLDAAQAKLDAARGNQAKAKSAPAAKK